MSLSKDYGIRVRLDRGCVGYVVMYRRPQKLGIRQRKNARVVIFGSSPGPKSRRLKERSSKPGALRLERRRK